MSIMLNPSIIMFIMLYMSSFFFVLSCSDWLMVWLGLELNMISFIMLIYNKYSMMNIESCMKYFFIQSLGSVLLLFFFYININLFYNISSMILCYKIGGGPFYFWFPSICENIGWWSCYFLMTFQKVMPLLLMYMFISWIMWMMSFISLLIGVLGSMNQLMIKQLMVFSSIHHIGWMMISFFVIDNFWFMYLFMYSMMLLSWMNYLNKNKVFNIMKMINSKNKWIILMILFNLGGIPPLMGFFLKWWSFYYFLMSDFTMLMLLIMFSVMMLYIYFRMIYDFVLGSVNSLSWMVNNMNMNYIQYDMVIILSFMLGSFMGMLMI